jgi:hypothetical protein
MGLNRARLKRIEQSIIERQVIRNPLIVGKYGKNRYFLLEDTAILDAVKNQGIISIPAQIVDFDDSLEINACIIIDGFKKVYLDEFAKLFPRSLNGTPTNENVLSSNRGTIVSIDIADNPAISVSFKSGAEDSYSPALFDFFDFLQSRCRLLDGDIITSTRGGIVRQKQGNCIISIPRLKVGNIAAAAERGLKFPIGLLHFNFDERILGIDFPVPVLKANESTREKEQFLQDLVDFRLRSGYAERIKSPVYLLNH